MNNISLQQIQYFKIAMKCSSFSQAAKLAYTTQSTISKNIAALIYAAKEGNHADPERNSA